MKQFALTIAGVFVGLLLFFIGIPLLLIASAAGSSKPAVHAQSVLELDLRGGLTDQAPTNPFAGFGGSSLSVMRVVDVLAQAQDDDRIKVVLVRLPESGMTPASADELRQAIRRFRDSGKPVIAHSQGLMPLGAVVSTYMLGASASEFWMQENASFQATGLASEEIFFGRAFERYGITADFEQRYEYKNAVNTFTQSDFTEAHREAAEGWMTSIYVNALANAAADRSMEADALRTAFEAGPHTPAEAEALGLIDNTGGVREAEAGARRPGPPRQPRRRGSRRARAPSPRRRQRPHHPLFRIRLRRGRAHRLGSQRHRHCRRRGRHPHRTQLGGSFRRRLDDELRRHRRRHL
ncbi:MAG: S49 family peptidase [Brevundimonas sp.]